MPHRRSLQAAFRSAQAAADLGGPARTTERGRPGRSLQELSAPTPLSACRARNAASQRSTRSRPLWAAGAARTAARLFVYATLWSGRPPSPTATAGSAISLAAPGFRGDGNPVAPCEDGVGLTTGVSWPHDGAST